MPRTARRLALALFGATLITCIGTGCVSYAIGQGAETAPVGQQLTGAGISLIPGTLRDSSGPIRRVAVDTDVRYGIDDRTDIGLRINTWTGAMFTVKRQLGTRDAVNIPANRARTAVMLGAGMVNVGEHAAFEATVMHSGRWTRLGQLYGGARVTQVMPITASARHDDPVVGVAFGHLFGDRKYSIGPELGIYYDRSVLGLNASRILVIPTIVVRGNRLPFSLGR